MIQADQELVAKVLDGALSPAAMADLFDEDRVYFAVRRIEESNFEWLRTQLSSATSITGRDAVASILSEANQKALLTR